MRKGGKPAYHFWFCLKANSPQAIIVKFVVGSQSNEATPAGGEAKEYLYSRIAPHLLVEHKKQLRISTS